MKAQDEVTGGCEERLVVESERLEGEDESWMGTSRGGGQGLQVTKRGEEMAALPSVFLTFRLITNNKSDTGTVLGFSQFVWRRITNVPRYCA